MIFFFAGVRTPDLAYFMHCQWYIIRLRVRLIRELRGEWKGFELREGEIF